MEGGAHDSTTHAAMVLHVLVPHSGSFPVKKLDGTMGCNERLPLRAFLKEHVHGNYRVGKHAVVSHTNHSKKLLLQVVGACWPHPLSFPLFWTLYIDLVGSEEIIWNYGL